MKCPSCNKDIDESVFSTDLTFCPYCGGKIETINKTARLQFCPYCGQKLTTHGNFCPNCGKMLPHADGKPGSEHLTRDFIGEGAKTVEKGAITVVRAIRNTFGRERKVRKLYQQWAEFSNLPPEEIPTVEELKNMSAEEKSRENKQINDED